MSIKDIRVAAGMTQREFANTYRIPLQTIKQWESDPDSKSFRKPPEYIEYLLYSLVVQEMHSQEVLTYNNQIVRAAIDSKNDAQLWFRYLRKVISENITDSNREMILSALNNKNLSMFQRISLKQALDNNSLTNRYIVGLNQRTRTPMIKMIMEKHHDK